METKNNAGFIAVDPGRSKCGYAVFSGGVIVDRGILTPDELSREIRDRSVPTVVVGNRTGAEQLLCRVFPAGVPSGMNVWLIDENMSSAEGRRRFIKENRRGWRRFWPVGLQSPWRPYDDFVAVILGERYLAKSHEIRAWEGKSRLTAKNKKTEPN